LDFSTGFLLDQWDTNGLESSDEPPVSEFQNINSSKKNINKAWRDRQGLIGGHSE